MATFVSRAILKTIVGGLGGLTIAGLMPTILGLIGFGPAGPIAGSVAAAAQASVGNVAAGSLFAFAQSVAMGGIGAGAWIGTAVGSALAWII